MGLRLGLAIFGLVTAVAAVIVFLAASVPGWAVVFLVVAAIAAVNIAVVAHRMRQRDHAER